MDRSEVMDLINEIEEKFPVDTWVVDDIHVWPLIRIPLAMNLYNANDNLKKGVNYESKILAKLKRKALGQVSNLKAMNSDKANNDFWYRYADAVFLSDSSCRTQLINGWYDRYCEPFIEEFQQLGWSTILYEATGNYEYRIPRSNKSVFIQGQLDKARLHGLLAKMRLNSIKYTLNDWDAFVRYCYEKEIDNETITLQELLDRVNTINITSDFFKRRMLKNKPKVAFVECYYSQQGMAFNLTCKRLGIPSVDIQHGVQGDYHVAYGRWNKIPNDGYELLPSHFWCWTSNEEKAIDTWSKPLTCETHRPIIGSNLWLEKWLWGDDNIIQMYDSLIWKIIDDNCVNILYTMQPGYDPQPWFYNVVNNSPSNWRWFVRLHQNMMHERERVKTMFNTNCPKRTICIDTATDLPLLAWLRHIDVHVTQFSSCVIESEAFGVRSVITHTNGVNIFKDQINNGNAVVAYNMDDLLQAISHLINMNVQEQTIRRKSSNINFSDLIDEIMACSLKKSSSS